MLAILIGAMLILVSKFSLGYFVANYPYDDQKQTMIIGNIVLALLLLFLASILFNSNNRFYNKTVYHGFLLCSLYLAADSIIFNWNSIHDVVKILAFIIVTIIIIVKAY